MFVFRAFLLTGLVFHKALWEILKRGETSPPKANQSFSLLLVKAVKVAIFLGVLVQTVLPMELFAISTTPFRLRTCGLVLYTLGLITALLGRIQLGKSWSDIETPRAAEERAVVSHGVYAYIRHPIYSGDLLLLLGLELALNSWLVLGVAALIPVVFQRAVKEENLLSEQLSGYGAYVQRTKRFIPFVV